MRRRNVCELVCTGLSMSSLQFVTGIVQVDYTLKTAVKQLTSQYRHAEQDSPTRLRQEAQVFADRHTCIVVEDALDESHHLRR